MATPTLLIRKRMQHIQGRTRPCCFAQVILDDNMRSALTEHFANESLFRRAAYSTSWPKGALDIPAAIAPAVGAFLKSDACPEITVRTLLAGQLHQAANVWEMLSFEFVAKLAFENLLAVTTAIDEFGKDTIYLSQSLASLDAGAREQAESLAEAALAELRAINAAGLAAA